MRCELLQRITEAQTDDEARNDVFSSAGSDEAADPPTQISSVCDLFCLSLISDKDNLSEQEHSFQMMLLVIKTEWTEYVKQCDNKQN